MSRKVRREEFLTWEMACTKDGGGKLFGGMHGRKEENGEIVYVLPFF